MCDIALELFSSRIKNALLIIKSKEKKSSKRCKFTRNFSIDIHIAVLFATSLTVHRLCNRLKILSSISKSFFLLRSINQKPPKKKKMGKGKNSAGPTAGGNPNHLPPEVSYF